MQMNYRRERSPTNLVSIFFFFRLPTPFDFNFEEVPSPRLIKTHLPMQLLPKDIWTKKPKIIYVVRDPRDAFVSSFHQIQFFLGLNSVPHIETFVQELMNYSCFWEHVLNFYKIRKHENIIFYSFEQMKMDLRSIVNRVCEFFGKKYSDDELTTLLEHLDFKNMKGICRNTRCHCEINIKIISDNESCSHRLEVEQVRKACNVEPEAIDPAIKFIRNGVVGGHRNELSSEFLEKMDVWEKRFLGKYALSINNLLFT